MKKDLQTLKADIDMIDLAQNLLGLKVVNGYATNCPWIENHKQGDEHPSLLLGKEWPTFVCQACGQKGDAFSLYEKVKGASFSEAINKIAEFYGGKYEPERYGNAYEFSHEMIDKYRRNLYSEEAKSVLEYIYSRGFDARIIDVFNLGWNGLGITIPRFLGFGDNGVKKIVGVKVRIFPDRGTKYISLTESKNILYNYQCLRKTLYQEKSNHTAIVVEGEFDVMAMWKMGFRNVVSSSSGAGSFLDDYAEYFKEIKKVFIFYDNDEAGQLNVKRVAKVLGSDRCFTLVAPKPHKDANDILMKEGAENGKALIDDLLKNAKPVPVDKTNSLARNNPYLLQAKKTKILALMDYSEKMRDFAKNFSKQQGILTGLNGVDKITGGIKNQYCYLIGADNKVGKSYFILNLMFRLAGKIPQVYFDLENGEMESLTRMVKVYKKWSDEEFIEASKNNHKEIDLAVDEITKKHIVYFDSGAIRNAYDGKLDVETLEHLLIEISSALDGKPFMFYIDHLKYFDIPRGKDEYSFYAEALRRFVDFGNNFNATSFILVHTRKGLNRNDKDGNPIPPKFPSIEDIAGSHMLSASAKCTILLYRDYISSNGFNSKELKVRVASGRSREHGECSLSFYNESPYIIDGEEAEIVNLGEIVPKKSPSGKNKEVSNISLIP